VKSRVFAENIPNSYIFGEYICAIRSTKKFTCLYLQVIVMVFYDQLVYMFPFYRYTLYCIVTRAPSKTAVLRKYDVTFRRHRETVVAAEKH